MEEYETEEQQIEALKRWWKENGASVLIGLVLGAGALFGWRYYGQQQNNHAVVASDVYMQMIQSIASKKTDDKSLNLSNRLINDFSDTPYASLSALALAKVQYENGKIDTAIKQLLLAKQYAKDEVMKQTANLRLTHLYIENKNLDKALEHLSQNHSSAYDAQYEELLGDVYLAKGNTDKARTSYDTAIQKQETKSQWLKLKRQSLGNVSVARSDEVVSDLEKSSATSNTSETQNK